MLTIDQWDPVFVKIAQSAEAGNRVTVRRSVSRPIASRFERGANSLESFILLVNNKSKSGVFHNTFFHYNRCWRQSIVHIFLECNKQWKNRWRTCSVNVSHSCYWIWISMLCKLQSLLYQHSGQKKEELAHCWPHCSVFFSLTQSW